MAVPTKKLMTEYLGDNFTKSDEQIIDLYVEAHRYYRRLKKEVDKEPLMMTHTNKAGATNYIKNPLTIELTKQYQTLNNLLKSLGLTPAQRERLEPGGDEGDDFDKF